MNKVELKEKLLEELQILEEELKTVGKRNPGNEADWVAEAPKDNSLDTADQTELGDFMEEYESNTAILKQLEIRYNKVKEALLKIDGEDFGVCEVCGKKIEDERLDANPAATTCIEHK